MPLLDAIASRRSIRRFEPRPIPRESLDAIVEAGRLAPTARNMQEVRVVVVTDADLKQRIADVAGDQPHVAQAAALLVIAASDHQYIMTCGHPKAVVDGVIAGTQMVVQATAEGVGSCWIARFSEPDVRALLDVPDDYRVIQIIALGYAARQPRSLDRLPTSEFRRDNGW